MKLSGVGLGVAGGAVAGGADGKGVLPGVGRKVHHRLVGRRGVGPRLHDGLETSVPGLHILGAPAAWSFGPLMQFVSGTQYASQSLTRYITGHDANSMHREGSS